MELTLQKVAANLCVDTSTVHRIVVNFNRTGDVSKKKYFSGNRYKKLSNPVQLTVLHLVLTKPDMYFWEIQKELKYMFSLDVSIASICKLLKASNFSRKKLQLVALQRDSIIRERYMLATSLFNLDMMVFIDESGCDRRDAIRKYGYGLRGMPVKSQKLLVRGQRISVIAAMTVDCILDLKIIRGNVTGEIFLDCINTVLLQHLMTFNGYNPNSVIIMDNCSVHHVHGVVKSLHQVGTLVQFLPPYSPDYNPIELLFSKVKSIMRAMEVELSITDDIESIVLSAFSLITSEDCSAWVHNVYDNIHDAS